MGKNTGYSRYGPHRAQYEAARRYILATQSVCAICGKPVDKSLKYPHPLSPTVDHIIPLSRNGHPTDPDNLQLAHRHCNRQKSDTLLPPHQVEDRNKNIGLPQSKDWRTS